MDEDRDSDQMVVGIGQKERLNAISPNPKDSAKLWIKLAVETLSSMVIVQITCNINGKVTRNTTTPFQINNKLKAYTTLNIKNADKRVNKKLAVEAARYKGIVLIEATLKTFWERSRR